MSWRTKNNPNQPSTYGQHYQKQSRKAPNGRRKGSGQAQQIQERSVDSMKAPHSSKVLSQSAYGEYVANSLHDGHGHKVETVRINKPAHQVDLKLTTVDVDELEATQKSPDLERRSDYFVDAIQRGQTIPPILVHKLPDGTYQIIDGHARVRAYQKLGIQKIPAVENGLSDVLAKVGRGLGKVVVAGARTVGEAQHAYAEGKSGRKRPTPEYEEEI